jgi:hypothetical protein
MPTLLKTSQSSAKRNISDFDYHESVDGGHEKIEIRRYWTTSDISWLQGRENWKNLETICMVERERHFDDTIEKEYKIKETESWLGHRLFIEGGGRVIFKCGYPEILHNSS